MSWKKTLTAQRLTFNAQVNEPQPILLPRILRIGHRLAMARQVNTDQGRVWSFPLFVGACLQAIQPGLIPQVCRIACKQAPTIG